MNVNKVNLLLKITKNCSEIQEKFEKNVCKMSDANLCLLHKNSIKMICSNFEWNFCETSFLGLLVKFQNHYYY